MSSSTSKPKYSKGLAGVIAGETSIATVGKKGHGLMYRGYSLTDLANNCIFEEVAYLLVRGYLPNETELSHYCSKLNNLYQLPSVICRVLELTPKTAHPMDILRTVCSVLGTLFPENSDNLQKLSKKNTNTNNNDNNNDALYEIYDIADRLLAIFPSAIAYHYNFHFKNTIIDTKAFNKSDTIATHFIQKLHNCRVQSGGNNKVTMDMVRCLDTSMICYAEHGFAASTFANRVTTSTLSDAYSSICSAIGTLRGALHGGANEAAYYLIESISNEIGVNNHSNLERNVRTIVLDKLRKKEKIMGFGHRVYKKSDPRSPIMKKWGESLVNHPVYGKARLFKIANIIEKTLWDEKALFPNVDFPAAMAYHQCGIPTNLFTPLFVCARTAGWMSHIIEQRQNNRLIRPAALYIGPNLKQFVRKEYRPIQSKL